jgi:hypothetical protein
MGNQVTNRDDLVFLQLEECINIMLIVKNINSDYNYYNSIEIVADVPQYNSYDTTSQSQTHHICFLEREPLQNSVSADTTSLDPPNPEFQPTWQTWSMKHKPSFIVVRPEVFQCKKWRLRARFVGDDDKLESVSDAPGIAFTSEMVLVFSISK